ncbi:OLC1v1028057C2 [Oldenlandia corymbosa var. corymbosa]|uniref:OLC1v1028057C2 n=1 Tax=Oldenlandia corymbosa var. corymbosa TaxID=529605 RepID=A0AAV1CDW6_OLDCO|nr:OLC1v1028057C2 [Oldenlandia corymbosa var. corymbosa]
MESQLGLIEQSFHVRYTVWVREALDELSDSFIITDPCISGHPIVFASSGFVKVFGYSKDEVVGKNGRMFQGPKTDRRSVMRIREAIREEKAIQISLCNYRKDGTPFWMLFHMSPVFSKDDGKVIHFLAVQVPIFRKHGGFGCRVVRNASKLPEDRTGVHDIVLRCCRREVSPPSSTDFGRGLASEYLMNSEEKELEVDPPCEATEQDKAKAAATITNVLSVLTHYSEVTGRLVCGKRCCLSGMGLIGASANISFGRIKQSFVLTDPHLVDTPIVYANDAFLRMTGYARHEILGRNCRFLSGPDTDPATQFQVTFLISFLLIQRFPAKEDGLITVTIA